jgi:hypothetical protein
MQLLHVARVNSEREAKLLAKDKAREAKLLAKQKI